VKHVDKTFAGRSLRLETGRLAKQAAGSCLIQFGDTVVLATVTVSDNISTLPFFPLTVEYREKAYAAGKIPGGFLKREGRPSDEEVLAARVIDRSVRPLFPEGFKNEVQVFVYVLSADQENDADVLGMTAASAALTMSVVPWKGPIAAVRVGRVEGAWILNPTFQQLEFSDVDLTVSGSRDSIVMVEGGALELSEGEIVKALEVAQRGIRELLDAADELVADTRQPKMKWTKVEPPAGLVARVRALAEPRVTEALNLPEKAERAQALAALKATVQEQLGAEFPDVPMGRKLGRAGAFFSAHKWREARAEYERLLPQLRKTSATADLERAELRLAQIKVEHKGSPRLLASLNLTDPEIDAERLYALSQAYRSKKKEGEMLEAIEQVTSRYPQSRWTEESLFAEANYFWVNLDRKRAASYYQRWLEQFPGWKNSLVAHWRVSWVAHLERRPEAAALQEEHLRKFPGSQFTANALYWLGRAAERAGNIPHARSFYLKLQERFPQTYFGRQAAERLRPEPEGIGDGPVNPSDVLALIPPPLPIPQMEEGIPAAAQERWTRVQALRSIAFDSSAELELRAAYTATGSLRLLWETAQSAIDAGHYPVGMATTRQAFPQLEARKIEDVPLPVWHTFFPLPFEEGLRRTAARHGLDPMLVAALIRQESTFQPDAVSPVGAIGLMQVLPRTAKKLARRLKLRYSRAKLFDPEYNLQLGTLYLADLIREFGKPEAALAAFNAGEERVAAWRAERDYEEPAEFVESIPFTETREYVQIIMRNAEVYRRLYGQTPR